MNNDVTSLGDTIKPKSDQLNADDLIVGPINVTITGVRRGAQDQPVVIDVVGDGALQPFKPCKTVRRILVTAWGDNGNMWVGKSMTLFCDPTVKFGGVALGGIRVSHLSDISGPLNMMLTTTRSKRAQHVVNPLVIDHSAILAQWQQAATQDDREALWLTFTEVQKVAINNANQ